MKSGNTYLCSQCKKPLKHDIFGYYCPVHGCEGKEGYMDDTEPDKNGEYEEGYTTDS